MKLISVAIITKNSEKDIKECVEAIKWVDEIIILDLMSTDNTIEICKNYPNLKVVQKKVDGPIGPLRNFIINKTTGK